MFGSRLFIVSRCCGGDLLLLKQKGRMKLGQQLLHHNRNVHTHRYNNNKYPPQRGGGHYYYYYCCCFREYYYGNGTFISRRSIISSIGTITPPPSSSSKSLFFAASGSSLSYYYDYYLASSLKHQSSFNTNNNNIALLGVSIMIALATTGGAAASTYHQQLQNDSSSSSSSSSCDAVLWSSNKTSCEKAYSTGTGTGTATSSSSTTTSTFNVRDFYDIQEILGEGAFGKVFRAKRKCDGKPVALKAIGTEFTSSNDFQNEITALEELSMPGHDHVCKLYEQHCTDNVNDRYYFLALELIPGGELFEYLISQGPFSEQDAAKFMRQLSQALVYIHSKGYAHADLKPENLMMGSGKLKVVDFGCATKTPPIRHQQHTGEGDGEEDLFFGTTAYLPPEVFPDRTKPPTQAIDCFAAGIIMYIILTGSHPFDPTGDGTDEQIQQTIMKCGKSLEYFESYVFGDGRTDHLSPSSVSLIKALLQPNPQERMTSQEFDNHPWIQGREASKLVVPDSHLRLKRFWKKRFRAAIVKKYFIEISSPTKLILSDDNIRNIFRSMDIDNNGRVDRDELKLALADIDEENMDNILQSLDEDGDGTIDFDEFKKVMNMNMEILSQQQDNMKKDINSDNNVVTSRLREMMKQQQQRGGGASSKELIRIFNSIKESPDSRTIHISTLIKFLKRIGLEEEDIVAWADCADRDMNGEIDFEEFSKVMMEEGLKYD